MFVIEASLLSVLGGNTVAVEFVDVDIPKLGDWQKITEGVLWLRMPLPFELDHINLYLIEDNDPQSGKKGYTLIDTGIGVSKTQALWDSLLDKLTLPLLKVVVTHMHPDHIGMAGYLVDKFRVPLYMSHSEYFVARAISAGSRGASDWQDDEYLLRCGMPNDYIETASKNRKESKGVGQVIKPIPVQYERLQAGDKLAIGSGEWQVIIGRGHSPEHVCLYNKNNKVLISGDHVLPIISPNIGVYSTEPNANPLKLYLETLPQFKDLPQDCLVLPSHKRPFIGLHERVEGLISHHQKHLENLREFCFEPKTIHECLPLLFKRKLNQHSMFFALAEAFAHLNYLYFAGEMTRDINHQGHYVFTSLKIHNSQTA